MDNATSEFWFERAKMWADSISSDPREWRSQITHAELIAGGATHNAKVYQELLRLLVQYVTTERQATCQMIEELDARTEGSQRPPLPLYIDMVKAVHAALVKIGPVGTPYLLEAYRDALPDAPEKLWFLEVMADIGDPITAPLFDALDVAHLVGIVKSESEIGGQPAQNAEGGEASFDYEWRADAQQYVEHLQLRCRTACEVRRKLPG